MPADPSGKYIYALYLRLRGSATVLNTSQTGPKDVILESARTTNAVIAPLSTGPNPAIDYTLQLVVPVGWVPGEPIEFIPPF